MHTKVSTNFKRLPSGKSSRESNRECMEEREQESEWERASIAAVVGISFIYFFYKLFDCLQVFAQPLSHGPLVSVSILV